MARINFVPISVQSWKVLLNEYSKISNSPFVFRGQLIKTSSENNIPELITSFESALLDADAQEERSLNQLLRDGLGGVQVLKLEEGLLREFKRKCSLYLDAVPSEKDRIEWLGLMRHYGAPTRLLDWTYSFYSAIFMALDRPPVKKNNEETVVWALNTDWLRGQIKKKCKIGRSNIWDILAKDVHIREPKNWSRFFKARHKFVYPVSPFRLNERLTIQHGTFLCQGDISVTFEDNLAALQDSNARPTENSFIKFKLTLSRDERITFLQELYRMNMTKASLYPGLQGFAESLRTRLIFPRIIGDPIQD
jgi:FRG domain-containing protein